MSLRDNTERHLFYKDIYKHRGYAYMQDGKMCGRSVVEFLERTLHKVINYCVLDHRCGRVVDFLLKLKLLYAIVRANLL